MLDEKFDKVRVIYFGQRFIGGKVRHLLAAYSGGEIDEGEHAGYFTPKKKPSLVVGGIYEGEGKLENGRLETIIMSSLDWTGERYEGEEVATWQALHRAAQTQKDAKSQHDKAKREDLNLEEILRPIADAYWRTSGSGRLALEVRILAAIRSMKP